MNGFFIRLYALVFGAILLVLLGSVLLGSAGVLSSENGELEQVLGPPLRDAAARIGEGEPGVMDALVAQAGPSFALIPEELLPLEGEPLARLRRGEVVIVGTDYRRRAYVWVAPTREALEYEMLGGSNHIIQWAAPAYAWAEAGAPLEAELSAIDRVRVAQRPIALSPSSGRPATQVVFSAGDELRTLEIVPSARAVRWGGLLALMVLSALALLVPLIPLQRQLAALERTAQRFGQGELDAQVPVLGRGNPARAVAEQFNHMAQRVQDTLESQEQLLRSVAHEMRTPLARLLLLVDLAEEDDEDELGQHLEEMRETAGDILGLTNELLDFARLDQCRAALELRPTDLRELLEDAAARWSEVELEAEERAAPVEADERLISRALDNLIANAMHYAGPPVVRLIVAEERYLIQIDDDGDGIPLDQAERVFEPFVRLESSRSRATGGTGLGLAIVARIAAAHGGGVRVDRAPLGGARLELWLPRDTSRHDRKHVLDGAEAEGGVLPPHA